LLGTLTFAIALNASAALGAGDETPLYAQTASFVAKAIHAGEDISQVHEVFELPPLERSELAKLSGCDGTVQPAGERKIVIIDWICGEGAVEPGLSRSIAMIFDEGGNLYGFAINGLVRDFKPTEASQQTSSPPSTYRVARRFGDAVVAGEDPTLDGHVPLSAFDLARLAQFQGGTVSVARRSVEATRSLRFTPTGVGKNNTRSTIIYFDDDGLPIGVIFQPSYDENWKGDAGRDLQAWTSDVRNKNKRYR
jgi:hypothetical protein